MPTLTGKEINVTGYGLMGKLSYSMHRQECAIDHLAGADAGGNQLTYSSHVLTLLRWVTFRRFAQSRPTVAPSNSYFVL